MDIRKKYHKITLLPALDKRYKYMILIESENIGSGFFAQTEDEMIDFVLRYARPEDPQITLF